MQQHARDLARFLTADPKGRQLPGTWINSPQHLAAGAGGLLAELKELADNMEHIKEIVAMQQTYARWRAFRKSSGPRIWWRTPCGCIGMPASGCR